MLWLFGGLLAIVLVLRIFVADLYKVDSGSMEPTIHGDGSWSEWVLVRYGGTEDLERFDLAVARSEIEKLVVKRVVGLPGETVQIRGGDLFIDGSRLSVNDPRPPLITLFDSRVQRVAEEFRMDAARWRESDTGWTLDSRGLEDAGEANTMFWRSGFRDGYVLPDLTRVAGKREVNDGGVEFEVEFLEPGGTLFMDLREAGDCFRASVRLTGELTSAGELDGTVRIERLRILKSAVNSMEPSRLVEPELLAEMPLRSAPGSRAKLHFSNVDNTLLFQVDDEHALAFAYGENRPLEDGSAAPGMTIGAQVSLGGHDLHARFDNLRVLRDFNWISRGEYAVDRSLALGPGEYFLLGDNSAQSLDGRTWGPTRKSDVLGRPVEVIWPRERARSLDVDLWRRDSSLKSSE